MGGRGWDPQFNVIVRSLTSLHVILPTMLLGCSTCPLAPGDEGVALLAPELARGQAGQRLAGRKSTASHGYSGPSLQEEGHRESVGGMGGAGRVHVLSVGMCTQVRGVTHRPSVLPQDGNVRLYSILGTTLKDEGKLLEAKGPVTDLAFSHDGAFLAVCDASKVVTVFSVADGYSVSGWAPPPWPTPGSTDGRKGPQPLSLVITDGWMHRTRGFAALGA